MNRITRAFTELSTLKRKALSVFLTAGFPSPTMTIRLAGGCISAGADVLEIGIPFSDPLADGPVIQASSAAALAQHSTPGAALSMVREIRKSTDIPIILMGYVNPLLARGIERFVDEAVESGADGMIVPDLPPEECPPYWRKSRASGLAGVLMVTPSTSDMRIAEIDSLSSGFVYAVTVNGVTGESGAGRGEGQGPEFIRRARKNVTAHPLLAGFGISDPDAARRHAGPCDGVIVGSAVMERVRGGDPETGYRSAVDFIATLRQALDS